MSKTLELRYVAHVSALTGTLVERYETAAGSLRELIDELETRYPGFQEIFIEPVSGRLSLQAMIYSLEEGKLPASVTDLDQPVGAGGAVVFW
jgi:hypothetical protein